MAFAKFQENQFRIDREITENHVILVNLTASILYRLALCIWQTQTQTADATRVYSADACIRQTANSPYIL